MWHMLFDLLLALVLRDAGAWMSSAQGRATIRARPRQDRRCRGVRSRFQAKRIILLQRRAQTRQKLRATPRPAHSGRIAAYMCRRARNNRLAATRRGPGLHRLRCRSGGRRWVVRVVPIVSVPSSARDRNARARLLSSPFEDSGVEAPSRQELGFSSFGFDNASGHGAREAECERGVNQQRLRVDSGADMQHEASGRQVSDFSSFDFGSAQGQELGDVGAGGRDLRSSDFPHAAPSENLFARSFEAGELHSSEPASSDMCRHANFADQQATSVRCISQVHRGGELQVVAEADTFRAPRGGGKTNQDFLQALQQLVEQFNPTTVPPHTKAKGKGQQPKPPPGGKGAKAKGTGGQGKGPKGGKAEQAGPKDDQLLAAIGRLVQRASVNGAQGLGDRIRQVLASAEAGKLLASGRAERKRRAKARKAGEGQLQSFYGALPRKPPQKPSDDRKQADTGWQADRSVRAITAGEAKRRLQDLRPLDADNIVVRDSDQAAELQDLARVHAVEGQVALISPGDLGAQAVKADVTCVKGDRREVREWHTVALTQAGCPTMPQTRKVSSFKPPIRRLTTVRLIAVKAYMEAEIWKQMQGGPREVANTLLGIKMHRGEGWKLITASQGEVVFIGYATFEDEQAKKVLQLSGCNGLFVEALARDQPTRPLVQWIPSGDMTGPAYLRHALRQAGGKPLAFRKGQGAAALGIRSKPGEAVKAPSTWRVRGVPKAWCASDVIGALEGTDFTEVTVVAEAAGNRPWLMRGTLESDTGLLALMVDVGDRHLRVERVIGHQRHETMHVKDWQPPRRAGKGGGKGKDPGESAVKPMCMEIADDDDDDAKDGGAPAPAGAVPGTQDAEMGDQQSHAAKRTHEPESQGQRKKERLGKDAWVERECGGQGHCFFNCITAAFVMKTSGATFEGVLPSLPAKGKGLRARIATHITEHEARYKPYFQPSCPDPNITDAATAKETLLRVEDGSPPQTWSEYLKAVYRPARYADEVSFRAASALLGVNISLICGDLNKPTQVHTYQNPKSAITVYLRHSAGHYTLLLPKGSELPAYMFHGEGPRPTQDFAPRGGGGLDVVADASWIPNPRGFDGRDQRGIAQGSAQVKKEPAVEAEADASWIPRCPPSPEPAETSVPKSEPVVHLHREVRQSRVPTAAELEAHGRSVSVKTEVQGCTEGLASSCQIHLGAVPSCRERQHGIPSVRLRRKVAVSATGKPIRAKSRVHWVTKHAKRTAKKFKDGKEGYAWPCDVCKMKLRSATVAGLTHARNNHICRVHKGVPKDRFSQLGPALRLPIATVSDCEDITWMCWHCREFLPRCQRRVRANSISAHIKQCELCPLHWSPLQNMRAILEDQGYVTVGRHKAALANMFQKVDLHSYRPRQIKAEPATAGKRKPGVWDRTFKAPCRRRVRGKQSPLRCYIKDLTEDGDVEPLPGPTGVSSSSGQSGHTVTVSSWNAQGSQNVLRLLTNGLLLNTDVVLVQETGLDEHLCREVSALASRQGFHAFFRAAQASQDSLGRPRRKGGLATFVRRQHSARMTESLGIDGDYEALCVKVGHSLVVNMYRVPSGCFETYQLRGSAAAAR